MDAARPHRRPRVMPGDPTNAPASGMGIAMPNSTAAGSSTAGVPEGESDAVAVDVGDTPATREGVPVVLPVAVGWGD